MKSYLTHIFLVLSAGISISLNGCIEEPVQQDTHNINGTIYGSYWSNDLVSAGDYPIVAADVYGNFETDALSLPYYLVITESPPFQSMKVLDITTNKPKVVINENRPFAQQSKYFRAIVKYPPPAERKYICTKFVSSTPFFSYDRFEYTRADSISVVVRSFGTGSSISGKLYYIEAAYDNDSEAVVSYDKFGEKDILFNEGTNNFVTFTSDDIAYDPDEFLMHVNYSVPGYSIGWELRVCINFPGMYKDSDIDFSRLRGAPGYYLLPVLPVNGIRTKVEIDYINQRPSFLGDDISLGRMWKYFNIGENANVNAVPSIQLVSPQNGSENVRDTTVLRITDPDEHAVYEYSIFSGIFTAKIISNRRQISLSEFNCRTFTIVKDTEYKWQVRKFPGYYNVDQFISMPYVFDDTYEYVELSELKSFKTAP